VAKFFLTGFTRYTGLIAKTLFYFLFQIFILYFGSLSFFLVNHVNPV